MLLCVFGGQRLNDRRAEPSNQALVQTQHDAVLAAHNDVKKLRDDSTRAK